MTTILIADSSKASLVMTSEVFKDKITGALVLVASSGKETLEHLNKSRPDLCVVDFDLPDVDGATLVEEMRKVYNGPILLTAFPDAIVQQAVNAHLFTFNDASGWLAKPIDVSELNKKIDQFLIEGHRLGRRFNAAMKAELIAKAAGRGKRAPKVQGKMMNISLGGACVKLDTTSSKVKKSQEITLSLTWTEGGKNAEVTVAPAAGKSKSKTRTVAKKVPTAKGKLNEAKLKAKVAWISPDGQVGLQFAKLTDLQMKGLVAILRGEPAK